MTRLPISPPLEPMLARLLEDIPEGEVWLYEPKWDGFRALGFVDGDDVHIASRRGQPLQRYFPEVAEALARAFDRPAVVDGEIIIAGPAGLDFDALQLRIHPAASRVRMLAAESPARFVAFDLLAFGDEDLRELTFADRRRILRDALLAQPDVHITPQTDDAGEAKLWFERYEGAGLDGVVAKRRDQRYVHGERAMMKIKHLRTVDCVVGGYRLAKSGDGVASLLLGLYAPGPRLHYVGHTSSFKAAERRALLEALQPLVGGDGFGGGAGPGGPSRWNQGRDTTTWVPLRPELVCEVAFDHMQGPRFRHATRFLRWRPDKAPEDCTYDQLTPPRPFSLDDVFA